MATRKPSRTEWQQKAGKWSRSLGNRGTRIRLFQKRSGGKFYRAVWLHQCGLDRKCIGTADRGEADRIGRELVAGLLRDECVASGALPLSLLWERYQREAVAFLDNDPRSRAEAAAHAGILVGFFGRDCDVRGLTEQDQLAFVRQRLAGGIAYGDKRVTAPVRMRSVEVDLQLLHTMLRWATTVRVRSGQRLLEQNPLAGIRRPRERNPKRPVATWERFQRTRRAIGELIAEGADDVQRRKWLKLDLALVLAEATGRRLGSIRQLRWEDIDLVAGTILWRAEHDKKGKEWRVPIPPTLRDEIRTFRVKMGGVFGGLVFPSESDSLQPIRRDVFGKWLQRAEKRAGLAKLDGSLWHAYRRSWATSRKSLPATDVAVAGGWKDVATMIRCYQQPDDATLLEVMSHSRKIGEQVQQG